MPRHQVKITVPKEGTNHARIWLDGRELSGLTAVDIALRVNDVAEVTLTFVPDLLEVDGWFDVDKPTKSARGEETSELLPCT